MDIRGGQAIFLTLFALLEENSKQTQKTRSLPLPFHPFPSCRFHRAFLQVHESPRQPRRSPPMRPQVPEEALGTEVALGQPVPCLGRPLGRDTLCSVLHG